MYFGSSPSYMKKESSQSPFWGFHFTGRKERKESQRRYKLGATGRRVRSIKEESRRAFPLQSGWVGADRAQGVITTVSHSSVGCTVSVPLYFPCWCLQSNIESINTITFCKISDCTSCRKAGYHSICTGLHKQAHFMVRGQLEQKENFL